VDEWNIICPNFTMKDMIKIISDCIEGYNPYLMFLSIIPRSDNPNVLNVKDKDDVSDLKVEMVEDCANDVKRMKIM
jgi:hypothetical protein